MTKKCLKCNKRIDTDNVAGYCQNHYHLSEKSKQRSRDWKEKNRKSAKIGNKCKICVNLLGKETGSKYCSKKCALEGQRLIMQNLRKEGNAWYQLNREKVTLYYRQWLGKRKLTVQNNQTKRSFVI